MSTPSDLYKREQFAGSCRCPGESTEVGPRRRESGRAYTVGLYSKFMRFDAGYVEEIADHIRHLFDIVDCERQVLMLFGIQIAKQPIQYIGCEQIDCRQRGAKFVWISVI